MEAIGCLHCWPSKIGCQLPLSFFKPLKENATSVIFQGVIKRRGNQMSLTSFSVCHQNRLSTWSVQPSLSWFLKTQGKKMGTINCLFHWSPKIEAVNCPCLFFRLWSKEEAISCLCYCRGNIFHLEGQVLRWKDNNIICLWLCNCSGRSGKRYGLEHPDLFIVNFWVGRKIRFFIWFLGIEVWHLEILAAVTLLVMLPARQAKERNHLKPIMTLKYISHITTTSINKVEDIPISSFIYVEDTEIVLFWLKSFGTVVKGLAVIQIVEGFKKLSHPPIIDLESRPKILVQALIQGHYCWLILNTQKSQRIRYLC